MADQTVVLTDQEWGQLVAIIAQATGYATFQKLVTQLQAQSPQAGLGNLPVSQSGDGLDYDPEPPARRVPRA